MVGDEGVRLLWGPQGQSPRGLTPWVKICGITNLEDALTAIQAGADALGFNLVPTSPRMVTRDRLAEILSALPRTALTVGVVADEDPDFLKGLLRICPLDALQFHGEEPPEEVLALKGVCRLFKAIRVKDSESLKGISHYQGVEAILLDTYRPDQMGGIGQPFDWDLAKAAKAFGIPIVVAGGLTPTNVSDCIRQVEPFGVDVTSGVELSPGRKNHDLIRAFIANAKQGKSAPRPT